MIDITYDMQTDSNGKDPDSHSKVLRSCHRILWSKTLPNGKLFDLDENLHHKSNIGEFWLSSDGIAVTFARREKYQHIISQVDKVDMDNFYNYCCTIGGFIVFPGNKINNKHTINQARGCNASISDRTDLTFECIRRYYKGEASPLYDCLCRYDDFFGLFESFKGYVDYFLMQDIVNADYSIKYWHPFDDFKSHPMPQTVEEYIMYKDNVMEFVRARNQRIDDWQRGLKESRLRA